MLPFSAYAANITPEISLDEFTKQLQELQAEYDDDFVSEITIENNSESYFVDGEENIIVDSADEVIEAVVSDDDIEVPLSVIKPYCELPEVSTYSLDNESYEDITVDKEIAEALGFEIDIEDDKAVLTQPYQTERLIVKSKYDINPLDSVAIVEGYNDLHIVQFDNQESAKQAEAYYNKQKLIEYAEPDLVVAAMDIDYTVEASAVTSKSINYGNHLSWGSESIGVDDYIDYLGDVSELPEIIVGIIDTGIDLDHPFLQDRIIKTNYNTSGTGTKDCEDDDRGHGTHVAGIVVDNTTENVKIKGFKCLNSSGSCEVSDVVLAIDAAVENGVNIINMSLGAKGISSTMEKAVNNAVDKGIVVVVAAGNDGANASKYCPAGIEKCITVAAYDANDKSPFWTNYGSCVDIAAPGVLIYSTYIGGQYETLSGTSMASPFVAAASALMLSKNPSETSQSICDTFQSNALEYIKPSWIENVKALYIGTVTEYNSERTAAPKISYESGQYLESITVELTCEDEGAEIYYTLDGSRASKDTGILYTEPIIIDRVTSLHAVSYTPNKLKSLQSYADYYIVYTDSEEKFEIDSDGIITAYNGTNNYLKIPDIIAGITVTGIGASVFYRSDIVMIEFPDTLTYVGEKAFYFCKELTSINAKNIKYIDQHCFEMCKKLAQINLTNAEVIKSYGCRFLKVLDSFYNDKLTVIEDYAFANCNNMINIDIPNVTKIGSHAFLSVFSLESLNVPEVEEVGDYAFSYCSHIETIDLPKLTSMSKGSFNLTNSLKNLNIPNYYGEIPPYAFFSTGLKYFDNDRITSLGEHAFDFSDIQYIKLKNAISIGENAFDDCRHLETVYIPNVTEIKSRAFKDVKIVKVLFAPSLETAQSLPYCYGVSLYLSEKFTNYKESYDPETNYKYTIIAPSGSYAEQLAKENEYIFIPSDYRDEGIENPTNVTDLGRSICTYYSGLRFGFEWNEIPEIEELANNIEYGFIYSQKGIEDLTIDTVDNKNVRKEVANKRITDNGCTGFNLVFADIPESYIDKTLSARAYVCIDGMYFYSNVQKGSFSEVATLVLADNEIDTNTKNVIKNLLGKEA